MNISIKSRRHANGFCRPAVKVEPGDVHNWSVRHMFAWNPFAGVTGAISRARMNGDIHVRVQEFAEHGSRPPGGANRAECSLGFVPMAESTIATKSIA